MAIKSLYYLSPRDIRKNRTDAVHMVHLCDGFRRQGLDVTLLTPTVQREGYESGADPLRLYGLNEPFRVVELPTRLREKDGVGENGAVIRREKVLHAFRYFWRNRERFRDPDTVVYSKCFALVFPYLVMRRMGLVTSPAVFEAASVKPSALHRFVYRNVDAIIAGLIYTQDEIVRVTGADRRRFNPTPLRFLSSSFHEQAPAASREEVRRELGVDQDRPLVVYGGKLVCDSEQVRYFFAAARELPEARFLFVGVNDFSEPCLRRMIEEAGATNVLLRPFCPLPQYYAYLQAADVLIDYYPTSHYNRYFLGPGKAASYLASGVPVVFPDLPSLRHLFPDDVVFFSPPDSSTGLAETCRMVLTNPDLAREKAARARAFARENSFEAAARTIIDTIDRCVPAA